MASLGTGAIQRAVRANNNDNNNINNGNINNNWIIPTREGIRLPEDSARVRQLYDACFFGQLHASLIFDRIANANGFVQPTIQLSEVSVCHIAVCSVRMF